MTTLTPDADPMPDVARRLHQKPQGTLDWVGMSEIHQPLSILDEGEARRVQASVQVYVDLADPHAKGIHMSRLYLLLEEHARTRPLSLAGLRMLLNALHGSHHDISNCAYLRFDFGYEMRQRALKSEHAGWSVYPTSLIGTLADGRVAVEIEVQVTYSSTCPCSAALARQLIQRQFEDTFDRDRPPSYEDVRDWLGTEEGIVATPHSQRSYARARVRLADEVRDWPLRSLVTRLEGALGTPVQTAVKRSDEQEFARLNGQNPMFCEDAARKLQAVLDEDQRLDDFHVRIEHHESLHAHNAVAVVSKGVEGGYLPVP